MPVKRLGRGVEDKKKQRGAKIAVALTFTLKETEEKRPFSSCGSGPANASV
jgi:hypothetical protein